MDMIDFPRRPHSGRATGPRPFELARQMIQVRARQKALAGERRRLLESLARLDQLAREMESIQADLQRLSAALRSRRSED